MNVKSEREKMLAGELYFAADPHLVEDRQNAKEKCYDLNNLRPKQVEEKKAIIKSLFKKVTDNFWVEPPFYCDYGYGISVGDYFYSNHNLIILDGGGVEIGDRCYIAPNVGLYCAGHPKDPEIRNQEIEYCKKIKIGNNVWIGAGVSIIGGVTIGDNVTIGAGSVVTRDIPSNSVAVGNPCKVIKEIKKGDI